MAFEMIKNNFSLWQEFIPKSRHLPSSLHPAQLAKYLLSNTPFYPTSFSLVQCHFPQAVCLMLPEEPFTSTTIFSNKLRNFHAAACTNSLCLLSSCEHWFFSPALNLGKVTGSQERGEVLPWQALGRFVLRQVDSCPPWS